MNLSALFIRRPIGTILLTLGVIMGGIAGFGNLPVAPLPNIDAPVIFVQANLPGASPETMASSVAGPLERRLQTIAGVSELTSQSQLGQTRVLLVFDISRNSDSAARDVQAAINAARADLPATLKSNPTYIKANPNQAPILVLGMTSQTRSPAQIYDAVSNLAIQKLSQIDGVGQVQLGGATLPATRIDVNPLATARYGLSLEDVRVAVAANNANRPKGVVEGGGSALQIYGNDPARTAADFKDLVVAWRNGAAVRLADVAHVYDGPEDVRTLGLFNGRRAVMILIRRQPGANIIRTVDDIKAKLPELQASLPKDIKLEIANDRTVTIRASVRDVEVSLIFGVLLVVLVVSVFLRSWRVTIVPAVAVITSLAGTIGVIQLLGLSLNNFSLMALTVASGFVVDDAIVVLENITRYVEAGMRPYDAALKGAREVGFTVISISISLVAVFIPILFASGIQGKLFAEFGITITVAVLISLVVSLITTPMLTALLSPPRQEDGNARRGRIATLIDDALARIVRQYARSLDWALANRGAVLVMLLGCVILTGIITAKTPRGIFPEQDVGVLNAGVRADQSISFDTMSEKLRQVVGIVRADPAVKNVVAFIGGPNGGVFMLVILKPVRERDSARAIIARLRPKLSRVTGISAVLNPVQDFQLGGRGSNALYQYTLKADDSAVLKDAALKLTDALKKNRKLADVDLDLNDSASEAFVTINKDAAAKLGLTSTMIDNALYDGFGQRQVANIYSGINQYHVILGVDPAFARAPDALGSVYVPVKGATSTGVSIAPKTTTLLSGLATWKVGGAPSQVNHQDAGPAATVSFNLAGSTSLGEAGAEIEQTQLALGLPAQVHGGFAGTAKAFSSNSGTILILAAFIVIYLVLGMLYENLIHPITVLSTLPSAAMGGSLALLLSGAQFDLIAIIGLLLLIGIVKKNAIMMIDFALARERERGLTALEAIREAALLRFRPILMTTLAAGFGVLPLAIGFGDGAELRRPLGIVIIGGLIASQLISLLTTPVVYVALDSLRRQRRKPRLPAPGLRPVAT